MNNFSVWAFSNIYEKELFLYIALYCIYIFWPKLKTKNKETPKEIIIINLLKE